MTRDPDEPGQALLPGFDRSLQGSSRSKGAIPFIRMTKGMELNQVDLADS
jgi:hypothetical protein